MRNIDTLKIGDIQLTWLRGGEISLDGGAMFGVVPKTVWTRKYPCNEQNLIRMVTDPILVQTGSKNYLIDSGIGLNKLSDKHKKFLGVTKEFSIDDQLAQIGLSTEDIDGILMTHLHNDHAAGLTKRMEGGLSPVFPNAVHYVQSIEWEEMRNPNIRSQSTYLKENWQPIEALVEKYSERLQVADGVELIHTGGHSAGHVLIRMESKGQTAYHLADILPSHAHQNPLWVMAYDDYPMNSIFAKQRWIKQAIQEQSWFTFYHDAFFRAIKWDEEGNTVDQVKTEHTL